MIKKMILENFKRYTNQDITLDKPLTILVGPNSSGKSSLLKALLAFKQTFEDRNDHAGFLSFGDYVDIGPFSEYVRNHNIKNFSRFIFDIRLTRQPLVLTPFPRTRNALISIKHELDPQTGHGRTTEYKIKLVSESENSDINFGDDSSITYKRMAKAEESFKLSISIALYNTIKAYNDQLQTQRRQRDLPQYSAIRDKCASGAFQAKRSNERGMVTLPAREVDYSILSFITQLERSYVTPFQTELAAELTERTFALAALREIQQRSSPKTDERLRVGARGQNTASVYFNFRERALKAGTRRSKIREDYEKLGHWIDRLQLSKSISGAGWRDLIGLRANVAAGTANSHSLVDMGVGMSQALPILVQMAVMPDAGCLILEQPELHLYPWAQSEVGRILCEEAKRANKRFIVETHSEHIVRGIQGHISNARTKGSEEFLSHEDVLVLYVDSDRSIIRLEIDENGEFINRWPPGFFDQGIAAVQEILVNKELPTLDE